MSKRRTFRTINPDIVKVIRRLHKENPQLGHEGLLKLLLDQGMEVDQTELRLFMKQASIKAEPAGTHIPRSPFPISAIGGLTNSWGVIGLGASGLVDGGDND